MLLVSLLSLIGPSGCEQAEEAKKAITKTVDKTQEKIKEVIDIAEESGGESEECVEPAGEKESR